MTHSNKCHVHNVPSATDSHICSRMALTTVPERRGQRMCAEVHVHLLPARPLQGQLEREGSVSLPSAVHHCPPSPHPIPPTPTPTP